MDSVVVCEWQSHPANQTYVAGSGAGSTRRISFMSKRIKYRWHARSSGSNASNIITLPHYRSPQDEEVTLEILEYAWQMALAVKQPWDPRNVSLAIRETNE